MHQNWDFTVSVSAIIVTYRERIIQYRYPGNQLKIKVQKFPILAVRGKGLIPDQHGVGDVYMQDIWI